MDEQASKMEAQKGSLPRLALQLLLFAGVQLNFIVSGQGPVRKNVTCIFEPSSPTCDWRLLEAHGGVNSSVVSAENGPRRGPATDVNPGTAQGHYYYFSSDQLLSTEERVLTYPSSTHQFSCSLSFSYFVIGPLEVEVLQENLATHPVFMSSLSTGNETQWQRARLNLNISDVYSGSLVIIASNFDLGEAAPEPGSETDDVFLAIDDIILTLCLPCDYDSLGDVGAINVDGPEMIEVSLRLVDHHYQFNASSPVCPNETFAYAIESVEPVHVSPIFSIDTETGVLTVSGRGPYLDANGTSGILNVSVHVASANYSETSTVHRYILSIPFHQPPTITHTAPPNYVVTVGNTFTYSFMVMSSLGSTLDLGGPVTTPPELYDDIIITPQFELNQITISGTISLAGSLPFIVQQGTPARITLPIEDDANGGVVYVETQLMLRPSPPLFNQSTYEYSIPEVGSNRIVGPFAVIDPNGDPVSAPSTNTSLFTIFPHIPSNDDQLPEPYSYFDILVLVNLNYEQHSMFSFAITAIDAVSHTLSSTALVTINVLPVNEHSPVFLINHKEVTISDTKPAGSNVTDFEATDLDEGLDGRIDYTITAGNEDRFFGISGAGFGEVIVQRIPILPHTYTLTVTATDRGSPPRSAYATLIIHVTTSQDVNCTLNEFGRPEILSTSMAFTVSRGDNITMDCQFTSNPEQRLYKWQFLGTSKFINTTDSHYTVAQNAFTIYNITPDDAIVYLCNVTNQCGSNTVAYTLVVIDYPNEPSDLNITGPADTNSIGLSWTPARAITFGSVMTPLDGYIVQTRVNRKALYFSDVMEVGPEVTEVNVTGLFPGTEYDIRVVSTNQAGRTPSESITFTTVPDVPRLSYLNAIGLANGSIALEWRLEYDGGRPISSFEIHITVGTGRARRDTSSNPGLVYHTDVNNNRLVTSAVSRGQTYSVMATASNILGASDPQYANAFVGHTDAVSCGYDDGDDARGCPWQLGEGHITNAQSAGSTNHLPSTDSEGNAFGRYISATLDPSTTESTLMTYDQAGYICGFSFSYFLSEGGGARIVVRSNPSRREVWSSVDEAPPTGSWQVVNYTTAQRYLTSYFEETLEIVLIRTGSGNVSAPVTGAVDNLHVKFCLPCNFEDLLNATQFSLGYASHARINLRQLQNLTIQAMLEECTQAVINFTISRVIPGDLLSRFSLTSTSSQSATVVVAPITPLLALPNTIGFIEVIATVAHSNYLYESSFVQRTALIEFILLSTSQNCSLPSSCTFDESITTDSCKTWRLGPNSNITSSSLPSSITSMNGRYIYSTYLPRTSTPLQIASAIINDSFCAISFRYICPASLELQVQVSGLGSIWSSVEVSRFPPAGTGGGATGSWVQESVEIDLQGVGVQVNRSLTFTISLAEGEDVQTSTGGYAALDNITLHPCIDCSAPECSFSTCFPGRYYSLLDESCIGCPQGYYCPNQWGLPQPCPPGTFSNAVNAASRSACQPCSSGSYAVKQASTSCQTCPAGYNCSNSSSIPVAIGGSQSSCPTTPTTCQIGSSTVQATMATSTTLMDISLIVVGSVGGVILLLCLVSTLLLTCFCLRAKKRRDKKIKRHNERRKFLLRDNLSIGTAGSLGASTMTSASSYGSRGAGKRKLKKRGDVSTLLSFLNDDEEPTVGTDPYGRETSWADTEQLTSREGEPGESHSFVMRNGAFEDVTLDDGNREEDEHHGNELTELSWQRSKGKKGRATSLL